MRILTATARPNGTSFQMFNTVLESIIILSFSKASIYKLNSKVLILLTLCICFSGLGMAQEIPWKHKKSEDGVEVYYRKSPDSRVNELKIKTTIDASIISVVAALRDIPAYTEWVMNCQKAEKLFAKSMVQTCYYSQVDFPWPLSDRDFIAQNDLFQDPATKIVYSKLKGVPDYLPEKPGFVRIQHLKITWKITPLSTDKVAVDYHFQSDPGGNIPAWMINLAIDKGPVSSIKKLRTMVRKEKYQTAIVPGIQNIEKMATQLGEE